MRTAEINPSVEESPKVLDPRARDIRGTSHYQSIEDYFRNLHKPAFGKISGAANLATSGDGKHIAFTGSTWNALLDTPSTRICIVNVADRSIETVTNGPNNDRLPKWSPDGSAIAFLSDRAKKGIFQLHILHRNGFSEAISVPEMKGSAEYLEWSPAGSQILVGMAGLGADANGINGAKPGDSGYATQSWMPTVESGPTEDSWRSLWVYDVGSKTSVPINHAKFNVWEATWLGPNHVTAIVSEKPIEESWYSAWLVKIDVHTGKDNVLHTPESVQKGSGGEKKVPKYQLGCPVANPAGNDVATITAICSDRAMVAGDILVVNSNTGQSAHFETKGVDVTQMVWYRPERLFYIGIRGFETVAGEIVWSDDASHHIIELCSSLDGNGGSFYPTATILSPEKFAFVHESWTTYPEITMIHQQDAGGAAYTITSFAHSGSEQLIPKLGLFKQISWKGRDGLEIQGLLSLPRGKKDKPRPLILNIHGGPVYCWQNRWLGSSPTAILVSRGYAVLSPNPRGSAGRGQDYARRVVEDMGGEEVHDHLTGIDMLVKEGVADPERIGVMGGSHGGFMASWIITQDERFKAAVPMAAVNHWLTQHTTSNIGDFDRIFFKTDPYATTGGQYLERSPVMFAGRYPTPVLQTAGTEDRCVPAVQGLQYHNALLEHGVESVFATYPGEGHGIRRFPAYIDLCARIVGWFERFMPA